MIIFRELNFSLGSNSNTFIKFISETDLNVYKVFQEYSNKLYRLDAEEINKNNEYIIGKMYNDLIKISSNGCLSSGFSGYLLKEDAEEFGTIDDHMFGKLIVCNCIIPRGTDYYIMNWNGFPCWVSSKFIIKSKL